MEKDRGYKEARTGSTEGAWEDIVEEKERQGARTGGGRRAEGGPYMQWRAIRRLAALALIAEIRRARGAEARRLAAPRR